MMGRTIIPESTLAESVLSPTSNYFVLYRFNTKSGLRELPRRKDRNVFSCKMLPLLVDEGAEKVTTRGLTSLKTLRDLVLDVGVDSLSVPFLAEDRPVTYLESAMSLQENWIRTLPGGIIDADEEVIAGGVREMQEELGLVESNVLCFSELYPYCVPYDSGSQMEWTQLGCALCIGELNPPVHEGFVPAETRRVKLRDAYRFLEDQKRAAIGVDGFTFALLDRLASVLHGGYATL